MEQLDEVFSQSTDEKIALVEAHDAERRELQRAHSDTVEALKTQFRETVYALEAKYNVMETTCLDELQQVRAASAVQLADAQVAAERDRATLIAASQEERDAFERSLRADLESLKTRADDALATLKRTARAELGALERSSSDEIRALREASASQFAEATGALTQQLEALRQSKADELNAVRVAHADNVSRLTDTHERETTALQSDLDATTTKLNAEIDALVQQHAREREATASAADKTLQSLKLEHAEQLDSLRAHTATELTQTVERLQDTLTQVSETHALEAARLRADAAVTQAALVERYEAELATLRVESTRERDDRVRSYETEIDTLRCSSLEALDDAAKAHDVSVAQLRDAHAAKTLQLETTAREQEKRLTETLQAQSTGLERQQHELRMLESTLRALEREHRSVVDASAQRVARCEMDGCEREMQLLEVQRELKNQLAALEHARSELRLAAEDQRVKANTILELTFVVKSRDDEVERLRTALLDSVKSVNQQTEILELTAETLSSKAKELEDTRAALRKESGRLSRVEESMHQKDGMLEDTELKVETMRLSMESLRLELKRLQMDMKLQLEHSEGEMELKNGEISRLHAAQSELRHKSAFQQQTIGRLEESLAQTQKQADDAQRRICLLRLEATQSADDAKRTSDALLERDQEVLVLAKDKQSAVFEKQRTQLQLHHLTQVVAGLHEKNECERMLSEEIQTRFLSVLAETSVEKGERVRAETRLLMHELTATKERVRYLESVELRLGESRNESEAQRAELQRLSSRVHELEATVAASKDVEKSLALARRHVDELTATCAENEHALACTHDKLRFESDTAQTTIAALTATLNELETQQEALQAERDALESQFEALTNDHVVLTNAHVALTNEYVILTNAQHALTNECDQERARVTTLAQQNEELTDALVSEKREKTTSVARLASDLGAAQQQLELQLRDAAATQQSAKSAADELRRELTDKCEEAAALQSRALSLEHDVRRLEEALQDATVTHERCLKESERKMLLKSEEMELLERTHELQLSARAEEYTQALRALEDASDVIHRRLETELREQCESFASQLQQQSAERTNAEDEQKRLTDEHLRQLSEAEATRQALAAQYEAALSALNVTHAQELACLQQGRVAADEALAAAHTAARERVDMLDSELMSVRDAFERELATRQQQLEDARVTLKGVVESARVKDQQQLQALSDRQAAIVRNEALLVDTKVRLVHCEEQTVQLLRELAQTKQALAESNQLVVERTATVDNVRRGTPLLATTFSVCCVCVQLELTRLCVRCFHPELKALHDTPAAAVVVTQSGDQLLARIHQQLDTHLWDAYQIDRGQVHGSGCTLATESDVVECLAALFQLRCTALAARRSGGGGAGSSAELVLSVADACSHLEQFGAIATAHDEFFASSGECVGEPLARRVNTLLAGYRSLLDHTRRVCRLDVASGSGDDSSGTTSELEGVLSHLSAFAEMLSALGLLGTEDPQTRCNHVLSVLNDHDELLQHVAGADWMGITTVADVAALLDTLRDVLADARRVTGQHERFRTPTDLQAFVLEQETLFTTFDALTSDSEAHNDDDSSECAHEQTSHQSPKAAAVLDFVRQSQRFVADCRHALGLSDSSSSMSDVLDCTRELMKVLQCFTGFEPPSDSSPRAVDSSPRSVHDQVASVLSFLDELHLMTDYAQSILDEESDATASTGASSNASSTESLRRSQSARTRTPTPSTEVESVGDDGDLQIEVPFPLDDLELELQQQDTRDDSDDTQIRFLLDGSRGEHQEDGRGTRTSVAGALSSSTPLAASLLDISLVMSDHQRVLSEAAHWVKKTAKLRRRRRTSRTHTPTDLGSEICRLVREHCALLSLGKQLFKLKDARRDLSSLLECLAILQRLTTRLSVFQDGVGFAASTSASSESLATSSARSNADSHESLRASLSVFACLDDIARHLQDYDGFVHHMRDSRGKQWLVASVSDAQQLAHDVTSRLELVAYAQTALGLENPVLELPLVIERMRTLLSETASLDPWQSEAEPAVDDDMAKADDADDSDGSGAPAAAVAVDLHGTEAHAAAFARLESNLTDYAGLVSWLRRALPFTRRVQSPDDLRERVHEVLDQLERFATASVETSSEMEALRAERASALAQQALEDAYLAAHGVAVSANTSRLDVFKQFVDERQQLRTATDDADASASLETTFLRQSGLLEDAAPLPNDSVSGSECTVDDSDVNSEKLSTSMRIQIYTTLLHKVQTGDATRQRLEAKLVDQTQRLEDSESALRASQSAADNAIEDEKAFLHAHEHVLRERVVSEADDNAHGAPRLSIWKRLVAEIARLSERERAWEQEAREEQVALRALGLLMSFSDDQRKDPSEASDDIVMAATDDGTSVPPSASVAAPVSLADRLNLYRKIAEFERLRRTDNDALSAEKRFLEDHGLAFHDSIDPTAARLAVYRTLLDGQNALIEEKMEREVELDTECTWLETHGVAGGSTSAERLEIFTSFVQLREQLAERDKADAMERAFLRTNGLWRGDGHDSDDDTRMDAQEQFGVRIQVFSEYAEARAAETRTEHARVAALEAERAFLRAHTPLNTSLLDSAQGPQFSRLCVFEALVATLRDLEAQQRALSSSLPDDERELLRDFGWAAFLDSTSGHDHGSAWEVRKAVYTTLSNRIFERDERICELEGSRERLESALLTWNEVPLTSATAFVRLEAEKHALGVVLEQHEAHVEQLRAQAATAFTAQSDALAAAAEKHALDLAQLERTHTEQVERAEAASKQALAAALEKQAKQLEFVALADARLGGATVSSALAPAQACALLLDKVAKRDTAAISMIYRSIRVATEILNTCAFARGDTSTSSSSGGTQSSAELPVEVTQAVLNCVKELKALKEYVAASLEQLTRGDDVFPPQPPLFVKLNVDAAVASGDKEAVIDLALCSHREFMAFAHCELLARQEATDARLQGLVDKLKAVAASSGPAAFSVAESTLMALEIERVRERETRDSAECELRLNDAYLRRLLDERKDVEAALSTALAALRDECRVLRSKIDALEHERYTSSSSGSMVGFSPRLTPMTPGYGLGSGVAMAPMRPEKPREPAPPLRTKGGGGGGAGSTHKERFVSDLERESGQRRSTSTTRRPTEWRRTGDLSDTSASSSSQLEREFRAMDQVASPTVTRGRGGLDPASASSHTTQEQEVWYQGVRSVHHASFFVTIFFVPKQKMFRVELFNSDTEQQQTVYVTWSEMLSFVAESKRAAKAEVSVLDDPTRRAEVADILFERVRVYGEGSASVLLGFE